MASHHIEHHSRNSDISYSRSDGSCLLTIGAMTYASALDITDYSLALPVGSGTGEISIGRFCSIAKGVSIQLFGGHDYRSITMSPLFPIVGDCRPKQAPVESESVIIGCDVWIGQGASILSGITIGNGAVVGANTVVSKDIPDYAIIVGNPCRILKYRFSDDEIQKLLGISWWNWDREK